MSGEKRAASPSGKGKASGAPSVPGFRAAGVYAGIKKARSLDLALVVSDPPAKVAGIFTQNRIQSPAVRVSRERIRSGLCEAVVINSGNANACTGPAGLKDARDMCKWTAQGLGAKDVLVSSTGVIGEKLPAERIRKALPRLIRRLRHGGIEEAAEAIRTTDRFRKLALSQTTLGGKKVTLCGIAKGAGMICPNMATMLAYFFTDLKVSGPALRKLLKEGGDRSFNRINVDGDHSTNDTVLLLANGLAGNRTAVPGSPEYEGFASLLFPMMQELAFQIVQDGEGSTKVVDIRIQGARSRADARKIAYHLSNSALVKTSFYGCDPNWGRLMAALGSAGPPLDPSRISIDYDGIPVVRKGKAAGDKLPSGLNKVLKKETYTVTIDLHQGKGAHSVLTSDLSHAYVTLNAAYRT